jgi:hypothetical protein
VKTNFEVMCILVHFCLKSKNKYEWQTA